METKELTVAELKRRMRAAGVSQRALGEEARLKQSTVSNILSGRDYLGPVRRARIEEAVVRLGLDKEPEYPREFRITQL